MFCTLLFVAFLLSTAFSASVLQSSQGNAKVAPDSLSTLNLVDPSSLEPIESDEYLNIHSTGSPQSPNTTVLLPNSSLSSFEYDTPFEYPGLNDLLGATNAGPQCKGENFGFNLSRSSCVEAYERFSNSPLLLSWGQRGRGNFQQKLPYRMSSFDGFCAIDVVHKRGFVADIASPLQIKQAAAQVMTGCIKNGAPNMGGMIGNVGQHGSLVVVVRLYLPMVTCGIGGPLARGTCNSMLDVMPVATERLVFGKAGDPATRVIIPRSFTAAGSRCKTTINPPSGQLPVTTRWFDVWAAAKSVDAMCVSRNQAGFAYSVGQVPGLMVQLVENYRAGSVS